MNQNTNPGIPGKISPMRGVFAPAGRGAQRKPSGAAAKVPTGLWRTPRHGNGGAG